MDTHTTCTTLEHTHPTNEIQSPIGGGQANGVEQYVVDVAVIFFVCRVPIRMNVVAWGR